MTPRATAAALLVLLLAAPRLTRAAALPADGGEPAKAYRACLAAIAKKDKPAMIGDCFAKDDAWLAKTNLDYFTPETFAVEVRQLRPEFRVVDVKVSGGEIQGAHATLQVAATMTVVRLEPTGDIIEVSQYPVKGTVTLTRTANGWRPTASDLLPVAR
jgi:hypothetical protein